MSLIQRSLLKDGTFVPCAVQILGQIPTEMLFHGKYKLRHPASIYDHSLQKIVDAYSKVAMEYLSITEQHRKYNSLSMHTENLLEYQSQFLHALQEHLDDLWLVLKTLVDPRSVSCTSKFSDSYVLESKIPGAKSFRDAVADYKSSLHIVNKLKHQQCFLRGVAVWSSMGVHLGYCLEEPDKNGILGPSEDIHPDQGAFSFARDLTWRLAQVYQCSEKLSKAIKKSIDSKGFSVKEIRGKPNTAWTDVVSLACKIPTAIFPKEQKRGWARFSLDSCSQKLTIKIPVHVEIDFPEPMKARYACVVDEYSNRARVPQP